MSVQELYRQFIKPLAPADRLRLARLILNDIPPEALTDYSEEWSEQDQRDFNEATWQHIEHSEGA